MVFFFFLKMLIEPEADTFGVQPNNESHAKAIVILINSENKHEAN